MLMTPVLVMFHNTTNDTYHPGIFSEVPLPGPYSPDKPMRHKSKGHHTTGFKTREEAMENMQTELVHAVKEMTGAPPWIYPEIDIQWDGNGVPATVLFFPKELLDMPRAELLPRFSTDIGLNPGEYDEIDLELTSDL